MNGSRGVDRILAEFTFAHLARYFCLARGDAVNLINDVA